MSNEYEISDNPNEFNFDFWLEHYNKMMAERDALRTKLDAAVKARDLAIAHDSQPYPTADAYEKVCKALENTRAELTNEHRLWEEKDIEINRVYAELDLVKKERDELQAKLELERDQWTKLIMFIEGLKLSKLSNARIVAGLLLDEIEALQKLEEA